MLETNLIIRRAFALLVGLTLMGIVGCQPQQISSSMEAKNVVDRFYLALKNKDLEGASNFFKDTVARPASSWFEQLKEVTEKLGDLQSHEIASELTNTVYSGQRYTIKVKTQYTKFHATETLVLFEGVSDNVIQIEAWIVNSRGLRGESADDAAAP